MAFLGGQLVASKVTSYIVLIIVMTNIAFYTIQIQLWMTDDGIYCIYFVHHKNLTWNGKKKAKMGISGRQAGAN